MDDHADQLSALLSAEQRITLVEARWEINLLIKAFGPALMQMELHKKEQDAQPIRHITKCYVPIEAGFPALYFWEPPILLPRATMSSDSGRDGLASTLLAQLVLKEA